MYFSRVTLKLNRLPYVMQQKMQNSGPYAIHQWLWQLFPNQEKRCFLFREERIGKGYQYYLLSEIAPLTKNEAAINWLIKQSETRGFSLSTTDGQQLDCTVINYTQEQFIKKSNLKPITYSSVDYQGVLTVTDVDLFLNTIYQGVGKSKGFGCGLFLVKHYQ